MRYIPYTVRDQEARIIKNARVFEGNGTIQYDLSRSAYSKQAD